MTDALVSAAAQAVARALTLGGIMMVVGATLFLVRVAPRLPSRTKEAQQERARIRTLVRATVVVLAVVACWRLVQQSAAFADSPAAWSSMVTVVLFKMTWGTGWWLGVAGLLLAGAAAMSRLESRAARAALGAGALLLSVSPAFMGHAIGAEQFTVQAVVADTMHVLAAGAWLGTLLAIAVATLASSQRPTHGSVVSALERFSPVALASAVVVAFTGSFASWVHLQTLGALWTSVYGRTLLIKLAILGGVAALGAYNWRVATPRLRASGDANGIRRSALIELGLALALVAVTAVLVATPLPGEM